MPSDILPVSARPDFIALPSDPCAPLTPEQSQALWGGDVDGLLRTIVRGAWADFLQQSHSTPLSDAIPERITNGH